jgi:LAO/AO transport system kinase
LTSPRPADPQRLAEGLLEGGIRALARSITLVENGTASGKKILRAVYGHTGGAYIMGVTGFPGAGKSTLVDQLTADYRRREGKVGVVAVDPSSAFSGGAILGDRIRMQRHSSDPQVFIRSLATRGNFGGLSKATADVTDLMDAAGYDPVLLETVGVGQDEIDIVGAADTVMVVLVPGLGDDIQAIKAGVLEIADLFVINKADQPGADRLERELRGMLSLGGDPERQATPILRTVATRGEGIDELVTALEDHRRRRLADGSCQARRRSQGERRFLSLLRDRLVERALERLKENAALEEMVAGIQERRLDPYTAVERVLADLKLAGEA